MNTRHLVFCRAAAYLVVAFVFCPLYYHLLRGSDGHLVLLTDDFYYYSIVAGNILSGHGSTFDGFTQTNGYHPLFMGVLVFMRLLSGGSQYAYFLLIFGFSALSAVLSFELMQRLARRLSPANPWGPGVAVLLTLEAARLSSWGMETTLAVPLALWWLLLLAGGEGCDDAARNWRFRRALLIGLTSALLVLARLDGALLVALLLGLIAVYALGQGSAWRRNKVSALVGFGLGGLPVPAYFLFNHLAYGNPMTVSAQSKQLSSGMVFNAQVLPGLCTQPLGLLGVVVIPLALILLGRKIIRGDMTLGRSLVPLLALIFPIVFFVVYGFRSDWIIFQWYFYPFVPAVFVALLLVSELVGPLVLRWQPALLGLVCLGTLALAGSVIPRRTSGLQADSIALYAHARQLAAFAERHPGRYAMGDRAGLTAYLLGQPVLQLEGLAADQAMVGHIRREDSLNAVLREYQVDHLIVSVYEPLAESDGCKTVLQPHPGQSGVHSRRMVGEFCQAPELLLQSPRGNLPGVVYTYVFNTQHAQ
jgi:hypothetical protein